MHLLAVKNWRTFQHYSDRRPPWVKLYVSLLDDLEFLALSEVDQLALIKVWMLAARLGHPLPNDPRLLQNRGGVRPRSLQTLIARGWLTRTATASDDASNHASNVASSHASTTLAEVEHGASPRARPRVHARASARSREGEGEREREQPPTTTAPPPQWDPNRPDVFAARHAYATEHRDPAAFEAALAKLAEPITGNGFGWAVVGQALVEMRANGKEWNAALCAGYCRRIASGPPPATIPSRAARPRSRQADTLAALAEGVRILESQEVASGHR